MIPSEGELGRCLSVPEAIVRRRATRRFDPDRTLPDPLLTRMLHLATFAPSGLNLQPWRFLVVRDALNRRKLRACAFNQPNVSEAPVVLIALGYQTPERTHLKPMIERMLSLGAIDEPGAAELLGRAGAAFERITDRALWATRSTMLAVSTLVLAAESLGVASAPMEGFDERKVRDAFGIPNDHSVCCLIALGFAAEEKPFPGRFGLEDVCFLEHFGQPWTLGNSEADGNNLEHHANRTSEYLRTEASGNLVAD
jgi:nitroreductase